MFVLVCSDYNQKGEKTWIRVSEEFETLTGAIEEFQSTLGATAIMNTGDGSIVVYPMAPWEPAAF